LTAFKPGFYDHSHCKQGEKPREAAGGCKLLLGKLLLGYSLVVSHASPWLWVK